MLLAFEIPTQHLEEFVPLEDFEFGLAHLFLNQNFKGSEEYVKLYQGCLLDNSMYELGGPLATDALIEATKIANPCALIAPDWMDDLHRTLEGARELYGKRPKNSTWTIGAVVQGKDVYERTKCFQEYQRFSLSPICFPFRSPRDETIKHLHKVRLFRSNGWYHLLGLRSLEEFKWRLPGHWSCDTGKPFKGYSLASVTEIRGHGPLDLSRFLDLTTRRLAGWNIAYLRKLACQDHTNDWKGRRKK